MCCFTQGAQQRCTSTNVPFLDKGDVDVDVGLLHRLLVMWRHLQKRQNFISWEEKEDGGQWEMRLHSSFLSNCYCVTCLAKYIFLIFARVLWIVEFLGVNILVIQWNWQQKNTCSPAPPAGMMLVFPKASWMKLFTCPEWERETITFGGLPLYDERGRIFDPWPTNAQAGWENASSAHRIFFSPQFLPFKKPIR